MTERGSRCSKKAERSYSPTNRLLDAGGHLMIMLTISRLTFNILNKVLCSEGFLEIFYFLLNFANY